MISALSDCVAPRQKHQGSSRILSRTPGYKWILPNIWHFSNSSARLSMKYFSHRRRVSLLSLSYSHPACAYMRESSRNDLSPHAARSMSMASFSKNLLLSLSIDFSSLEILLLKCVRPHSGYGFINLHEQLFHQTSSIEGQTVTVTHFGTFMHLGESFGWAELFKSLPQNQNAPVYDGKTQTKIQLGWKFCVTFVMLKLLSNFFLCMVILFNWCRINNPSTDSDINIFFFIWGM